MNICDVRAQMPNYGEYSRLFRDGEIQGIAIHHSATVQPQIGVPSGSALSLFSYHVRELGWTHGAYHYVIHANGLIEYALDEQIEGFHAGFSDPDDVHKLLQGQYWNRHYLAICLLGWFDTDRTLDRDGAQVAIPNHFVTPPPQQLQAAIALIKQLQRRHGIPAERVQGHRELAGCKTRCPGANVDLDALRAAVRAGN